MWLFTKHGFYSVVAGLKAPEFQEVDPDIMVVRARSRDHLENLCERFEVLNLPLIEETNDRDYRFRIVIPKLKWEIIGPKLTTDIDYDNFKDEAHRLGERYYDMALHDVWATMWAFQRAQKS